ncbi:hypothetical protein CSC94_11485 [Zhengella mangrovi]|uniref:Uncharacterized protein n=1 Tax=Zhengella mangrovi TaxID=1982044 RepID=A0A2G1QNQ0_9HYPH|nr:hypothetical protein [Zhengella mangrovi]PHP67156.1 hypothetical protein CSC94_11485 [Zhengella mangrovi]
MREQLEAALDKILANVDQTDSADRQLAYDRLRSIFAKRAADYAQAHGPEVVERVNRLLEEIIGEREAQLSHLDPVPESAATWAMPEATFDYDTSDLQAEAQEPDSDPAAAIPSGDETFHSPPPPALTGSEGNYDSGQDDPGAEAYETGFDPVTDLHSGHGEPDAGAFSPGFDPAADLTYGQDDAEANPEPEPLEGGTGASGIASPRGGRTELLSGLAAGLVLGVAAVSGLAFLNVISLGGTQEAAVSPIMPEIEATRPQVEKGLELINMIKAQIEEKGTDAFPALVKSKGFVRIGKDLFPEVANAIPKDFRQDLYNIIVRRGENGGYKILINSNICPSAALMDPGLVDPRRSNYSYLCQYFGLWNEKGKDL